jgi:hypothetical protein
MTRRRLGAEWGSSYDAYFAVEVGGQCGDADSSFSEHFWSC